MNTTEYTQTFKKRQIVIDIETIPNPDIIHLLGEPTIDSRLKDPLKVAEAKAEAKAKQLGSMALSPLTGKVAAIGYYSADLQQCRITDEKEMLDVVIGYLENFEVITYNGKAFDIPFIFKRGIILGCEWATIPAMRKLTKRFEVDGHIDLMEAFCNYGEREKLDNLGKFILGYGKKEFDFARIPELLKTEEGKKEISEYCLHDCKMTWELAKRMGY